MRKLLSDSQRPFVIVGSQGWRGEARQNLIDFASRNALPVGAAFRYQDVFDNDHPNYAGDVGIGINPKLAARIRESDLLLVLGARLGEMTTGGYTLIEPPVPKQDFVHVLPSAEELGRVYRPTLGILSGMAPMARALAEMDPVENPGWQDRVEAARADYVEWNTPVSVPGDVQPGEIVRFLRERLPPEALICNGAGNYAGFVHRYYRFRGWKSQLAPTSGSMGYGVPAAVAAKLHDPSVIVVAFAGDGCFQMTGQEFGTAVQYGANIVVVVMNNAMYGTIRMHQEREYPERISGTALINPDFVALAQAYGGHGERVSRTEDFEGAFERALAAGRPALIEVDLDPEAITPATTLAQIRAKALSERG